MDADLQLEAKSFDAQILERVRNGHIPDLRYTQKCEYFYNNVWRHPDFVKMDFGEIFSLINGALKKHINKSGPRILEVGCGPGYISLELARSGYGVTGIDVSHESIKIAKEFSDKDPDRAKRSELSYVAGDFLSSPELNEKFDAIIFVGALHHFNNQAQIMHRVNELLHEGGLIVAHEPTRDRVEQRNAAIYLLIKSLLSLADGYYQNAPDYSSTQQIDEDVHLIFSKMKYEESTGKKLQSINDNSAGFKEMFPQLLLNFEQLQYEERYAFFHELIGGLRFTDEKNREIANTIKLFDKYLCETGVIQPAEFFFVGRKKQG